MKLLRARSTLVLITQPATWSLTSPIACMKAYTVVGPTNFQPSFWRFLPSCRGLCAQVQEDKPYAASTRSGRNGVCRSRTPLAANTAAEIAGATIGVAIWPAPVGLFGVVISLMCISGMSCMRGTP